MTKTTNNSSEVKTVAKSNISFPISEEQYNEFIKNHSMLDTIKPFKTEDWDGKPFEEDRVYHMHRMYGIRILIISENRYTRRRALKMQKACKENGMTTPACLTNALTVVDWGLHVMDPITKEVITDPEILKNSYSIMEGHGRYMGWLLDLVVANLTPGYVPFDYHFIYKHFDSPEEFGRAYTSTNADMTRSTNKDRLNIAAARSKNPLVCEYFRKVREDGNVSKAAYFWTLGRELTSAEVNKFVYGEKDAPTFPSEVTDSLQMFYNAFKEKFGFEGAEKIYRGVSAAQWSAEQVKSAVDKIGTAKIITEKIRNLDNATYTAIITAKTNSKKHQTRDSVIKDLLSKAIK